MTTRSVCGANRIGGGGAVLGDIDGLVVTPAIGVADGELLWANDGEHRFDLGFQIGENTKQNILGGLVQNIFLSASELVKKIDK
jgi:hypothetical protein